MTFEQQRRLLLLLRPYADQGSYLSDALQLRGLKSFRVWDEFQSSFCQANEIADYALSFVAQAKIRISSPDGLPLDERERELLRADPCANRRRTLQRHHSSVVNERRALMHKSFLRLRAEELQILEGGGDHTAKLKPYAEVFRLHMIEMFGPLGFSLDEFRSDITFPVVSKRLTEKWDICWSSESERTLLDAPQESRGDLARMAQLDLRCYLRAQGSRGFAYIPIGFSALDVVPVRLEFLVSGFAWAYRLIGRVEELRLVIAAHAELYRLVGTAIERTLADGLFRL